MPIDRGLRQLCAIAAILVNSESPSYRVDDEVGRPDLRQGLNCRRKYATATPRLSAAGRTSSSGMPSRCASGNSMGTRYRTRFPDRSLENDIRLLDEAVGIARRIPGLKAGLVHA